MKDTLRCIGIEVRFIIELALRGLSIFQTICQ